MNTDLEESYRVNLNMIVDKSPGSKRITDYFKRMVSLSSPNSHKPLKSPFRKGLRRLEILKGLLIAYLNIDEGLKLFVMKMSQSRINASL